MKRSKEEAISTLWNNVPEFAKLVQPIYKKNHYTWAGIGVPNILQIKSTLYSLISDLEDCAHKDDDEKFHAISTGRLCVELICWEDSWHGKMMMTAEWMDLN
jgi:hypothetical protein